MIGREKEIQELNERYDSERAEFIAVYGRRRVGKTYLVDEVLKDRITFRHAGLSPVDEQNCKNGLKEQLKYFYLSLQLHGMKKSKCPTSWLEAFFMLEMQFRQFAQRRARAAPHVQHGPSDRDVRESPCPERAVFAVHAEDHVAARVARGASRGFDFREIRFGHVVRSHTG